MKVWIVARTRMGSARCIGGISEDGRSLRLLTREGYNYPQSTPLDIGQIWDIGCTPKSALRPPHVEDVVVTAARYVGMQPDMRRFLLGRVTPWEGGIEQIFGGRIRFTENGNGYVCEAAGVPDRSTGFWVPDRDLELREDGKHYDYCSARPADFWEVYTGRRERTLGRGPRNAKGLKYVGEADAVDRIPAGTLVRVSLARWWKPDGAEPDFEERCYLQLSGWF